MLHKDLTGGDLHIVHAFTYADAAARTGATGFVAADIGKIAKQSDDNTYYILVDVVPTWTQIDSSPFDTFIELEDTPDVYSGQALNIVQVKQDESGLEFGGEAGVTLPGGANTEIQYNDNGIFGGDANLTWDKTNKIFKIGGALALAEITTPVAEANYGKIYTKADNKVYFQDGAGEEHEIAFVEVEH